jgi:hypothetical protein
MIAFGEETSHELHESRDGSFGVQRLVAALVNAYDAKR